MKGNLRWRIALTLLVAVWGVVYALPSVMPEGKDTFLSGVLPNDRIHLGLDLQGGIHLTLGVDIDKALDNALSRAGQNIKADARDEGIRILRPTVGKSGKLQFVLLKVDNQTKLEGLLSKNFKELNQDSKEGLKDGRIRYSLSFKKEYKKYLADMTLDQAIKTIRNRIDQFGVTEPDIRKQQDYRIQVQLPGLKDPERAIQVLGQTAHLEFKIADDEADMAQAQKGVLPPGDELSYIHKANPDGTETKTPIVLRADAVMTGENIADANTSFNSFNQPYVTLTFDSKGARDFDRITGENVKKRMAIVLDGKVYSAPTIQERIMGGRASITGHFTVEEARDLAIVLRAGALPAPVKVLEERSVGPSLGQESIDKGIYAALTGGVIVVLFMAVYYSFAGIVADIVLVFNILLIMAGLASFGATLTLPGIAGIILTIGMAVDANVLIFERIREELRRGMSVREALNEGYSRATLTILDANLTTIIAAVILYQFGTGPIRGFAVTLSLGILASMFTAIFVSRILFDLWIGRRQQVKLSI